MKFRLAACTAALLALTSLCDAASAHTSYLLPNVFSTTSAEVVTVQFSFTEDFPRPEIPAEIPVVSENNHVLRPNGAREAVDTITALRQMVVLENDLTEAGTYRFSTGERLGRTATLVRNGQDWRPLEPGQTAPRGAQARTSQTVTVAEVYVTKGAPSRQTVDAPSGLLAIRPVTHPSEIYLADGFQFNVLFNNAPLANQELTLYREGGDYEEPHFAQTVRSDAQGRVHLSFTQPGIYMVMTRHRADAPAGSQTQQRSYTTSLTFEVAR